MPVFCVRPLTFLTLFCVTSVILTGCSNDSNTNIALKNESPGKSSPIAPKPLSITSVSPTDGATGIEIDATLDATFSQGVDDTTINSLSFFLTGPSGKVDGDISFNTDKTSASLTASGPLDHDASYTATLTTAIADTASPANELESELSLSFDTGSPWTKQLGTAGVDYGFDVTTDSSGNIYVTGETNGALDGQTHIGLGDIFITKYSADGAKQWTTQTGTTSEDVSMGISVDASGSIYITGHTAGDFGAANQGGKDMFVSKFDSDGLHQWTQQAGTTVNDEGQSIVFDGDSNLYITGYTLGDLDGETNAGGEDIFISKYNTDGVWQWTKLWGTASASERGTSITYNTDYGDHIYFTGYSGGSLAAANAGSFDIVTVKLTPTGAETWSRQLGTSAMESGADIIIDTAGNAYITGSTSGHLDGQTNINGEDAFLTKYDASGNKQWTRLVGGTNWDHSFGVSYDIANDNVYIAGYTDGNIDGHTNQGSYDIFMSGFNTDGSKQWTSFLGTTNTDGAENIATDRNGNVYITGWTNGAIDNNTLAGDYDMFLAKFNSKGYKK